MSCRYCPRCQVRLACRFLGNILYSRHKMLSLKIKTLPLRQSTSTTTFRLARKRRRRIQELPQSRTLHHRTKSRHRIADLTTLPPQRSGKQPVTTARLQNHLHLSLNNPQIRAGESSALVNPAMLRLEEADLQTRSVTAPTALANPFPKPKAVAIQRSRNRAPNDMRPQGRMDVK